MDEPRGYAYIRIQGALIIVPIEIIYDYLPAKEIETGIRLGKRYLRGRENAIRTKKKYVEG